MLEWNTMEYMVGRLSKELGGDEWKKYLSFYFPVRVGTPKQGEIITAKDWEFWTGVNTKPGKVERVAYFQDTRKPAEHEMDWFDSKKKKANRKQLVRENNRYMVYVHSKFMIVDDLWAILGSANLNERSLNGGRDSEICIGMWPAYKKFEADCKKYLSKFSDHLFKEHFGADSGGDPAGFASTAQKNAAENYVNFRHGRPLTNGMCVMLPLVFDETGKKHGEKHPIWGMNRYLGVESMDVPEWSNGSLPDAPEESRVWMWWSDREVKRIVAPDDLAE
jgi:hypothetical protein